MRRRRLATVAGLSGGVIALAGLAVVGPAAAQSSSTSAPRATVPGAESLVSTAGRPVASTSTVRVSVAVGNDAAALTATSEAVSTPGNARYGHYLTPAQVQTRFGASHAQQAAVAAWLRSAGLHITHSTPFIVTGLGSATAAESAIGTGINAVPMPGAKTRTLKASTQLRLVADTSPTAPASITSLVEGLNLSTLKVPLPPVPEMATATQPQTHANQPCSKYFGQKLATKDPKAYGHTLPYASCWYSPAQTRAAYAVPNQLTGKGVTVATVGTGTWPAAVADMNRWARDNGVQKLRAGQLKVHNLDGDVGAGELAEFAGDQEAIHGLAPDADLVYVNSNGGSSGDYFAEDLAAIVQHKWADIVSSSTGDCISFDSILNPVLQRAAAEGITVSEASGDWGNPVDRNGAGNCYVRDTPYETLVGGTSLAIDKAGNYQWELPWADDLTQLNAEHKWDPKPPGESYYYSEGGGGVTDVAEPKYQKGVVTHNVVNGKPMRVGPDVALEADCWIGGYPEGYQQTPGVWTVRQFCGTSMATPMFTALVSDVLQLRKDKPLGFLNPALYGLYGTSAYRQITTHSAGKGQTIGVVVPPGDPLGGPTDQLVTAGQCKSQNSSSQPLPLVTPRCGTGYNEVTGVGSVAPAFYRMLAATS
jgi:subtilase family serine protease